MSDDDLWLKTVLRCGAARFGLSITPLQELTVETKLRSEGVMNGHYDDNDSREHETAIEAD